MPRNAARLAAWSAAALAGTEQTPEERAWQAIANGALVIDVRSPEEFERYMVANPHLTAADLAYSPPSPKEPGMSVPKALSPDPDPL